MTKYHLSFCKITKIDDNIAEVVILEGIQMNSNFVEELHTFLIKTFGNSFSLLIDKKFTYSYTFAAQQKIGAINEVKAIAVINYNDSAETSTDTLRKINNKTLNLRSFKGRTSALSWLREY